MSSRNPVSVWRVRSLRRKDEREHRTTVFTTVGVVASTSTDEAEVDFVQNGVRDVSIDVGSVISTGINVDSGRSGSFEIRSKGRTTNLTDNSVVSDPVELITVASLPSVAGDLRHDVHDGAELLLTVCGEAEVFKRDAWRLNYSTLKLRKI
jgi:hypothetical protein